MIYKRLLALLIIIVSVSLQLCLKAQAPMESGKSIIRLNEVGFYPGAGKIAIITAQQAGKFYIKTLNGKTLFTGELKASGQPAFSGKYTAIANFSAFNKPGRYVVNLPGKGDSYPFEIKPNALKAVADGTIKAFYFQRASIALDEKYAGKWHREAGHPDDKVLIHASAATAKRPEGMIISSPRGWYDAGDYNKYIVNSGITTATLLSLYEDFPGYMNTVKLNIPESNNQLPDVLDEVLWNLRWMLTMQDPNDGGVYHKLTNPRFDAMIMPVKADSARYVVQKSTAATLDFAAVMAQASRIFKKFPKQLPGLADSCIKASEYAWAWAAKNPAVLYNQDVMNRQFKPTVVTGTYGDRGVTDEFFWAASELFVTTGKEEYLDKISLSKNEKVQVPAWSNVKLLGYYTLAQNTGIDVVDHPQIKEVKEKLMNFADAFIAGADSNAYQTVMTKSKTNFNWGSNSNAANQGILLIKAYKLSGNKKYLENALANLDYILGRNGTGYSYVTGFGSKPVMHPHHRPSVADGIEDPVPGLLSGGPNPGMQDKIQVPSLFPDEAFIDDDRSYATNEIAINWNAPMAYLANALEALQNTWKKAKK
ncbi:glycoside hydrolase family 9 protein [Mucilaginibacter sp. ZT4R22]|uniref:Endoglucanase n=1 Tax=Mucilaginibacter pankratovii TaxID=2772110 RepID=A0ABR7WSB8_9SPHI|nr:glycoside hydrolase family 9 protein [Mucilaginibacter pankratovii]MBD1364279.1 glycoside hydrolase family 9 protein [Mucilaginibacter pankratovii]